MKFFHELVDVVKLLKGRPAFVAIFPLRPGFKPHGEGFGKVFNGMALGVPVVEVEDETLAAWFGFVGFGIWNRSAAKRLLPFALAMEPKRILNSVSGLMPHELHAPGQIATFYFKHLLAFKFGQSWMR